MILRPILKGRCVPPHYSLRTMSLSRRHLLQRGVSFSLGFAGLHTLFHVRSGYAAGTAAPMGYGPLVKDPAGIFDLPEGFTYSVISRRGDTMTDGLLVPGQPDGMAAFVGPRGTTILVRNHEQGPNHAKWSPFGKNNELLTKVARAKVYDYGKGKAPSPGGTTTLVYNTKELRLEKQFLSLAGTKLNCAGGPTPWGSWLSCEEDHTNAGDEVEADHGYVFEVPATEAMELAAPRPIKAMGRFYHEAVCVDPATGIIYLTEDREDGLIYRFIPKHPGVLLEGGRLQALVIKDKRSLITSNQDGHPTISVGTPMAAEWMDLSEIDTPKNDLRARGHAAGAAQFARGEGMWWGDGCAYFACTDGGIAKRGQIWKYTPSKLEGQPGENNSPGSVTLFVEPNDAAAVENADNITVAPWGDLFVCEDEAVQGDNVNRLLGVTPKGEFYTFARNAKSASELAGVCFSPDGSTMFVNIQGDGLTLAVRGPWKKA